MFFSTRIFLSGPLSGYPSPTARDCLKNIYYINHEVTKTQRHKVIYF